MKTMITRDNVLRHNGTMRCLLGRKRTAGISGHYSEARSGSMRKSSGDAEAGGKQWKSSGRSGRRAEAGGRPGRGRKGSGRPGRGREGRGRGRKKREDLGK